MTNLKNNIFSCKKSSPKPPPPALVERHEDSLYVLCVKLRDSGQTGQQRRQLGR